jgi:hypothetical protein
VNKKETETRRRKKEDYGLQKKGDSEIEEESK